MVYICMQTLYVRTLSVTAALGRNVCGNEGQGFSTGSDWLSDMELNGRTGLGSRHCTTWFSVRWCPSSPPPPHFCPRWRDPVLLCWYTCPRQEDVLEQSSVPVLKELTNSATRPHQATLQLLTPVAGRNRDVVLCPLSSETHLTSRLR
jgi:hypothetical protein